MTNTALDPKPAHFFKMAFCFEQRKDQFKMFRKKVGHGG